MRIIAAIPHPIRGDIIHEATMSHIWLQSTICTQTHATQAQISHPITECVAETGALKYVAIFIQIAAHISVDIMIAR
jgi:hypothetical protein